MLLADIDCIHIDTFLVPARLIVDTHVVGAHLPLPHQSVLCKRPVLEAVRPPPLAGRIVPLVPELDCDLVSFVSRVLLPRFGVWS
jgi:hypothetical protein